MYGEGFFFQAFIYLAAAVISVPIAKRLGLGSVLGYLIAGVAIGPYGLQLVGEEGEDVMHFAEFGVVMMLFLVGLELQPSRLWRLRGPIMGMGGLQLGLTAAVIMAIGVALGLPWQSALAVGLILALSSTAIVLQTLSEKGLLKTDAGQGSFAVLLFQDIAVIPLLALLPLLAIPGVSGSATAPTGGAEHGSTWIESLPGWAQTLVVLGTVVGVILGGRFLVRPLFRAIAQTRLRELFTAAALLLVIGIALLMTRVGLSPALGTFLAGVVLADSEYRHELEANIDPFKGLLLGLFFIAVGASIDFRLVSSEPLLIGGLVCALIVLKLIVLFILGRFFKMGFDQNLLLAFLLAQGGEFAFVLFAFAVTGGILPKEITGPLVAVVAISMPATPLLMLLNEKVFQPRFGTREGVERKPDAIDEESPVIIAGFGRFGNIVGRLLRANGVQATVLDLDSDNVEMLRKLGMKVFYGDATRHELLHAAGAEKARLLILALDDPEKNLQMLQIARKQFPHLTILARANGRTDAYELIEAGVDFVYRETLDASLRLGIEALRLLGFPSYQAHRASKTFRRHDEHALRELAKMRHDRKAYISHARQRISDLEAIVLEEMQPGEDQERDLGWDTTSLRKEFGSRNRR
jgi:monovalent cation:proton antiporter-2 (CPA2) family protein